MRLNCRKFFECRRLSILLVLGCTPKKNSSPESDALQSSTGLSTSGNSQEFKEQKIMMRCAIESQFKKNSDGDAKKLQGTKFVYYFEDKFGKRGIYIKANEGNKENKENKEKEIINALWEVTPEKAEQEQMQTVDNNNPKASMRHLFYNGTKFKNPPARGQEGIVAGKADISLTLSFLPGTETENSLCAGKLDTNFSLHSISFALENVQNSPNDEAFVPDVYLEHCIVNEDTCNALNKLIQK